MVLDEDKIVSGSLDETIKIWSLSIGACLDTLSGHSHSIN
jgi:WD40 repeat protein